MEIVASWKKEVLSFIVGSMSHICCWNWASHLFNFDILKNFEDFKIFY